MAQAPRQINWFKEYPEYAAQMVNREIQEVIDEYRFYPLRSLYRKMKEVR